MNMEPLNEQAFKSSCQEIDELYAMLQYKSVQAVRLDEFQHIRVALVKMYGETAYLKSLPG